jgi:hypothetical protein
MVSPRVEPHLRGSWAGVPARMAGIALPGNVDSLPVDGNTFSHMLQDAVHISISS